MSDPRFTPQDLQTLQELQRLDSQLAGLFKLAIELSPRADEPGMAHVLGHIGREITLGLKRELVGPSQTSAEEAPDKPVPDSFREVLAGLLKMPRNHALVDRWFRLHKQFVKHAHTGPARRSAIEIQKALGTLRGLLYGRLAPYFDTQEELTRLLRLRCPTAEARARIHALLLRPIQRKYFFGQLQSAEWLEFLNAEGYFNSPPTRVNHPDGSWQARPWPEGGYLLRIAAQRPEQVTQILETLPVDNDNPAVWAVVADAIVALPLRFGRRLVRKLVKALQSGGLPPLFSHLVINSAIHLARAEDITALELTEGLTEFVSEEVAAQLAEREYTRWNTRWMLVRLDLDDLNRLLDGVCLPLQTTHGRALLAFLQRKLTNAIAVAQYVDRLQNSRADEASRWCDRLDTETHDDDVRAVFARHLAHAARNVASRTPASAREVLTSLASNPHEIFWRIRLHVLRFVGQMVPDLLDECIVAQRLLEPGAAAPEAAALLRDQFANASEAAQARVAYMIQAGPPDDVMEHLSARQPGDHEVSRDDMVAAWQRRRLRWFHDRIPSTLLPLATELGVSPQVPSARDQALDEIGVWSSGISAVAERSPITEEALGEMAPADVLDYLVRWQPDPEILPFEGPSVGGLTQAVASVAQTRPELLYDVVAMDTERRLPAHYRLALLRAFARAAQQQRMLQLNAVLSLAAGLIDEALRNLFRNAATADDVHRAEAHWSTRASLEAVADVLRSHVLRSEYLDTVSAFLHSVVSRDVIWNVDQEPDVHEQSALRGWHAAARGSVGGALADCLIALAQLEITHSRREKQDKRDDDRAPEDVASREPRESLARRAVSLLTEVLAHRSPTADGARARLGMHFPFLLYVAPQWVLTSETGLFGGLPPGSIRAPFWLGYLGAPDFHSVIVRDFRGYYRTSVGELSSIGAIDPDDDESLRVRVGLHLLYGMLDGYLDMDDPDALLEQTLALLSTQQRSKLYWNVFRAWSDTEQSVPDAHVRRLVQFWERRVDLLRKIADPQEQSHEAEALMWFAITPQIPVSDALRLGLATAAHLTSRPRTSGVAWERLTKFAETDPDGTFELAELLVNAALREDYAYLPYDQVAPSLRAAIARGTAETRERAVRLIHTLGEHGHIAYGALLREADGGELESGDSGSGPATP